MAFALLLLGIAASASAADDAFEFFQEEAKIVTASRRSEPAWSAPAAVDVITAEDIRAYGFKEIWDALRYRAGMDVIEGRSLDGNRALVSARGLDNEFVAEMQVLVDGRSAYSPLLGGVYWQDLPVQMQDVERIEIVRGPNAALYGSNAGLGVINIITKKPGPASCAHASAWGGVRSAYGASAAGEAARPDAGLRVSYESRADQGHPAANGASDGDDFLNLQKVHVRGRWAPDAKTELEVLGGGSWMTAGIPGLAPDAETRHRQNFESAKATRRFDGDAALEASLSRAETTIGIQPVFAGDVRIRTYQYDAELLHRFSWLDGDVKSSWGADWRETGADSVQAFGSDPRASSRLVRGFTHHSVRLAETATLVAGASLEHSGTGGTQAAGQAALLLTPVDDHSFRLSYSYAPTIPPLLDQHASYSLAPGQRFVGNPSFGPERVSSWEAGWSARLLDGALTPRLALYYMEVRDSSVLAAAPGGPGVLLRTTNQDRDFARGAELSADWAFGRGRAAFVNYTYERITTGFGTSVNGYNAAKGTPLHKFNVGARAALPRGFTISSVLGYRDAFLTNSDSRGTVAPIPRHFRLDARLGWSPRPGWELFVAGQELLQKTFSEYADGTATPRAVRGGVEARFP